MKKNKQSERSKQWLIEALLTLMEKKEFDSIKITDITEKAGVARLTFYRHFECKEDILQKHFDNLFETYLSKFSLAQNIGLQEALCSCFEYWKQDEKTIKLLIRHNLTSLIYRPFGDYLRRVLETDILPRGTSHFQKKFIEGGLLLSMIDWIQNPRGNTADDMAKIVLDLINIDLNQQ